MASFDHDDHANRQKAYDDALDRGFKVAFSAFCFENWYLLHFIKSSKAYTDADKLIKELKKHYPNYQKAKQNDFENLKSELDKAIVNAARQRKDVEDKEKYDKPKHITDRNPWTDVDCLIQYIKAL